MPANAIVFIHYGPYEANGLVERRKYRLEGLQSVLKEAGHSVSLVETNDRNIIELWVHGEMVFKCLLQELDFGGDGILDNLCSQALERVNSAF